MNKKTIQGEMKLGTYRSMKWYATKNIWNRTLEENVDSLCLFVDIIVDMGQKFSVAVNEIKEVVVEVDRDFKKEKQDTDEDNVFKYTVQEMVAVGVKEGKTPEEAIQFILNKLDSIPEPKFSIWQNVVRFFRAAYLNFKIKRSRA